MQDAIGWISHGALNYICTRLSVPPAEAWGKAGPEPERYMVSLVAGVEAVFAWLTGNDQPSGWSIFSPRILRRVEVADAISLASYRQHGGYAALANATLGSGEIMVFDETADLMDSLARIAQFFRDEFCGQCVPCRVGTVRQEELLRRRWYC